MGCEPSTSTRLLVTAGLLAAALAAAAEPPPEPLTPAAPVEREIAPGAAHRYALELTAGEAVRARALQARGDVALRLLAPGDAEVARADTWQRAGGEEELIAIAAAGGAYVLEVAAAAGSPPGLYRLRLEPPRAAGPEERARAAAGAAYEQARAQSQGPAGEAVAAWREAVARAVEAGDTRRQADALWRLGMALRRQGEVAAAIDSYRGALDFWRTLGDLGGEADARNSLGLARKSRGETDEARAELDRALELFTRLGEPRSQAAVLSNLATVDLATGELRRARDRLQRALELARAAGDRLAEAKALNNLGLVHNLRGESRRSLESYRLALDLLRALGDRRGEATALHNVGSAYDDLGDSETALAYFRQALATARELGDRAGEAASLQNLGVLHQRRGEIAEGRRHLEQALALARAMGDRAKEARALTGLGGALRRQGELAAAQATLEQAVPIARELGDRETAAAVAHALGVVATERGDAAGAVAHLEQALRLTQALGARAREAEVVLSLAEAHRRGGDLAAARTAGEQAVAQIESLRAQVAGQALRSAFGASRQRFYETQVAILMDLHRREPGAGHDAAALVASERGKARALLEILAETRAEVRQGAAPALLERERLAREEVAAGELLRLERLRTGAAPADVAAAETKLEAALAEHRRAETDLLASSPRYAALVHPEPLDLAGLRREVLDAETTLVEVSLGEERGVLWAVTLTQVRSVELPGRAAVEALAREVYAALTERNNAPEAESVAARRRRLEEADAAFARSGGALARLLFAGVADLLAGRRLVVVPDGALHYVPFAALPAPAGGGPLLLEHEVVSLPSASVLAVLRREAARRRPAARQLALLADPVFASDDPRVLSALAAERSRAVASTERRGPLDGDPPPARFPRLRFSRQEAEAIAALVAPEQRLVALDFAAARDTVRDDRLADYRLIHFATHGLLDSRHPELSSLVLSLVDEQGRPQDGFLRLADIYNLQLNADLVVLSACRTALGQEMRGEGIVGLTRGVMYAGSPRVVASLWSVEDRATAQLMRRFYDGMVGRRLRPAAALRAAQLELAGSDRLHPPYYWAAFVLQGEWR
jgi:CHAT domain-containing protein/tetratricopeptide (TPR) repeat protein